MSDDDALLPKKSAGITDRLLGPLDLESSSRTAVAGKINRINLESAVCEAVGNQLARFLTGIEPMHHQHTPNRRFALEITVKRSGRIDREYTGLLSWRQRR